ncbi:hypothetical protein ACWGQ6_38955 [Streptomyces niveus]
MGAAEDFNLAGKDWLTVEESAHYCGVSVGQFYAKVDQYNLEPREFMGKKLYEKAALYQAIYSARKWSRSQSTGVKGLPTSTGAMAARDSARPSVVSALVKLRKYDQRAKRS